MMKAVYLMILTLGLSLAVVSQFISYALPRDAFVAGTLSSAPEHWSLHLDERLSDHLSPLDVKSQVITALKHRAAFQSGIYKQDFRQGVTLIILSLIGLFREWQITKLKKAASCPGLPAS